MAWLDTPVLVPGGESTSIRRFWTWKSRGISAELVYYKETTTRTLSTWPGLTKAAKDSKVAELSDTPGYDDINAEPNPAGGWTVTATFVEITLEDITSGES